MLQKSGKFASVWLEILPSRKYKVRNMWLRAYGSLVVRWKPSLVPEFLKV